MVSDLENKINDFFIEKRFGKEDDIFGVKQQIRHALLPHKGQLITFIMSQGYDYADAVEISQNFLKSRFPNAFEETLVELKKDLPINVVGSEEFAEWKLFNKQLKIDRDLPKFLK